MFRRFAEFVIITKWPLLLLLLLLTAMLGMATYHLQIDPTVETLFVKDSPEYLFYQEYKERYGSDYIVAVAMETPDLFTASSMGVLVELTDTLEAMPEVERVLSLANALDIRHKFLGIKMVPALPEGIQNDSPEKIEELRDSILSNELYVHNLISADGKVANLLVYLRPHGRGRATQGSFIKNLRKLLGTYDPERQKFYVAGAPVEQFDFVDLIRKDQFTFVPMIAALLVITTFIIYRSLACTFLAMSIVFMTLIWTMGAISVLGQDLNLVTSLLAPVIMIIAVVNSIHLMNLFFEIRPHHTSLRVAVILTMHHLGVPCFLTHVTTMFGFVSLAISPVPAIQSFGLFAALGTMFSYAVELLLTPILLPLLPYRFRGQDVDEGHFFNRFLVGFLEKLEYRWKWMIVALVVASIGLSIYGIQKLEVDTNIVKQMKPDSPLAISTRFIDEHLTGVYSLGFVVRNRDGSTLDNRESLERIDAFKTYLEKMPEITKVNSITTVIKKIHEARKRDAEAYRIPEEDSTIERYFKGMADSEDPELWKVLAKDFRETRIEARMKAVGTAEGAAVEEKARAYMEEHFTGHFDFQMTGNIVLLGRMAKGLVGYQLKSFGIAFMAILLIIVVIFRSLRMGLLAAIPNLLPIFFIYGLMGLIGIELSSSTAMISSVVLGLVVDASIHFLHRFKKEFMKRRHYLQALHHTYRNVGQALVVASIILIIGFASSAFAAFRPTVHFGALTSLAIFLALLCTLLALPVCLIMLKPFGPQRLFKRKHPGA